MSAPTGSYGLPPRPVLPLEKVASSSPSSIPTISLKPRDLHSPRPPSHQLRWATLAPTVPLHSKAHPCLANLVSPWGYTLDYIWKEQRPGMARSGSLPSQPCSRPIAALPPELWVGPQVPISPGNHRSGQGAPPTQLTAGHRASVQELPWPGLAALAECPAISLRLGMRRVGDPAETSSTSDQEMGLMGLQFWTQELMGVVVPKPAFPLPPPPRTHGSCSYLSF